MNKFYAIIFLLSCSLFTKGQEAVNTPVTIHWPHDAQTDPVATYSDNLDVYFKPDYYTLGSNLNFNSVRTSNGATFRTYRPLAQTGQGPENLISFHIIPVTGLTFLPQTLSFKAQRYGTDSGLIDVVWKSSDGSSTTVVTGLKPARDNSGSYTDALYDLSTLGIPAIGGDNSIEIYLYSLGDTKEAGFADIQLTGQLEGSVVEVTTYSLTTATIPEASGSIETFPVGPVFDEGTEVTITASRNFGYEFSHWEDEAGQQVSVENPYTFVMNSDITLNAVFSILNAYSLVVTPEGGAKDYMITYSPSGEMVESLRKYEEGSAVIVTALENPIMTFTNWSNGETNIDLNLIMDSDKTIVATYSSLDYIVGWDFYLAGNQGRPADFYSTDENMSAALVLRDAAGNSTSWLDKSTEAAGGYEAAEGAAVNWRPIADKYYYQVNFDASDFVDISVSADMLFNFNAYSLQKVEYSLDGTNFSEIGTYSMTTAKILYHGTFDLPADANNASQVFIRWIPDYTSDVVGSPSDNDGTAISAIYVKATTQLENDGIPPVLLSTVPSTGSDGASATGKIVLNFDEKIAITDGVEATLGSQSLSPNVIGKTITFPYNGLDYATEYTFSLMGGVVSDLNGNTLTDPISITFSTLDKPLVTKKVYDFIVGIDGNFAEALSAAQAASSGGERFYIFFPNGEYDIGNLTGDATQQTSINIPNVSYIGESADGVVLFNNPDPADEGINTTPTINLLTGSDQVYMQDLTILNKMDYRSGSFKGRAVALRNQGDKNIFYQVKLLSNQDTYFTDKGRTYWKKGEIHGTVDFIFGDGDVFFDEVLIYLEDRTNNHVTAAATSGNWGYVFSNCTIDGFDTANGNYKLGRPWKNSPKTVFLNTTMKLLPAAGGWSEWNVHPSVYAEYNSLTESGSEINLDSRRTSYFDGSSTVTLDPVLTMEEAAEYTIDNVIGGPDFWDPTLLSEQAQAPFVSINEGVISWDNSDYVLGWALFKDGQFVDFIISNSYTIPANVTTGIYHVRAANGMGGLGSASNSIDVTKLATLVNWSEPTPIIYGTPLSEIELNATAVGNTSNAVYNPPAGTILNAGAHDLTVNFPADENYNPGSDKVTLLVEKAESTITWDTPDAISEGTPLDETQLNATVVGTSGAAIYDPPAGTIFTAGEYTLSVTFESDENYNSASTTVTLVVNEDVTLGTSDITQQISVYPNPVTGGNLVVSFESEKAEVSLYSLHGTLLIKREHYRGDEMDVSGFEKGIYLLTISLSDGRFSRTKIIIH